MIISTREVKIFFINYPLGFKHLIETLLKFKNCKVSPEALTNLKKSKADKAPLLSDLRKINHLLAASLIITIINMKNSVTKKYDSINAAAKDISVCHQTLSKYVNKDKLLKGIYKIVGG